MNRKSVFFVSLILFCVAGTIWAEGADSVAGGDSSSGLIWYVNLGTLALVNATLAQIKNRLDKSIGGLGAPAWFFFSLFLGPLATLIILVKD